MKIKFIKISAALILSMLAIIVFLFSPIFLVDNVLITGNYIVDSNKIKENSNIDKHNIFLVSKNNLEKKLLKIPYIKSIVLRKTYPNTVSISIKERIPVAYVKYTESELLCIDEEGMVLETVKFSEKDPNLIIYYGLDYKDFKIGSILNVFEPKVFKIISDLSRFATNQSLSGAISKVEISNLENIHVFVYDLDFEIGKENDVPTSVRKIRAIIDKLPNSKEIKAKINLDTGIVKLIT